MKFLALSLSLFALASLASDSRCDGAPNTNSSSTTVISAENEFARAFSIGAALAEKMPMTSHIPSVLLYKLSDALYILKLKSTVNEQLNYLFDMNLLFGELHRIRSVEDRLSFFDVRYVFGKCAKQPAAMVLVDVAILKWTNQLIGMKGSNPVLAEPSIVQALCGLSLYPQVAEQCKNDIIRVLDQFPPAYSHFSFTLGMQNYFSGLLTAIKILGPSEIRTKIEEITAFIYKKGTEFNPLNEKSFAYVGPLARMLLGEKHELLSSMEKNVPMQEIALWDITLSSLLASNNHNLHSLISGGTIGYDPKELIVRVSSDFSNVFCSSALVSKDNLIWYKAPTNCAAVRFEYSFNLGRDTPTCLHVICLIRPPAIIWDEITSCKRLEEVRVLLKGLRMRQAILTYGLSILETSAVHHFSPSQSHIIN